MVSREARSYGRRMVRHGIRSYGRTRSDDLGEIWFIGLISRFNHSLFMTSRINLYISVDQLNGIPKFFWTSGQICFPLLERRFARLCVIIVHDRDYRV